MARSKAAEENNIRKCVRWQITITKEDTFWGFERPYRAEARGFFPDDEKNKMWRSLNLHDVYITGIYQPSCRGYKPETARKKLIKYLRSVYENVPSDQIEREGKITETYMTDELIEPFRAIERNLQLDPYPFGKVEND